MQIITAFVIAAIVAAITTWIPTVAFAQRVLSVDSNKVDQDKSVITGSISPSSIRTDDERAAVAFSGRLLGDDQTARLIIEIDGDAEFEPFYMNNPPRLVLDMSRTAFRFDKPELLMPRGLVGDLRYGTMARGQSRMVLSLVHPVKIISREQKKNGQGRYKFTLDFEKVGTDEFNAQIAKQSPEIGFTQKKVVKGDRLLRSEKKEGRFTIVLDPGHGGIDGGAKGKNGTVEKDVTLEVAQRLEQALAAAGPYDVFLTRRKDYFLSLRDRVKIATRKQADLFISIHADTLKQKSVRGAAVYTLSKKASDEFARQLAEAENRSDLVAGLAVDNVGDEVVDILADLTARETKKFSRNFAYQIVKTFKGKIRLIKNPHRRASFEVLKDPIVPSVLVELGYLSNSEDEKLLGSEQWREKFTQHLVEAVDQFFATRTN